MPITGAGILGDLKGMFGKYGARGAERWGALAGMDSLGAAWKMHGGPVGAAAFKGAAIGAGLDAGMGLINDASNGDLNGRSVGRAIGRGMRGGIIGGIGGAAFGVGQHFFGTGAGATTAGVARGAAKTAPSAVAMSGWGRAGRTAGGVVNRARGMGGWMGGQMRTPTFDKWERSAMGSGFGSRRRIEGALIQDMFRGGGAARQPMAALPPIGGTYRQPALSGRTLPALPPLGGTYRGSEGIPMGGNIPTVGRYNYGRSGPTRGRYSYNRMRPPIGLS